MTAQPLWRRIVHLVLALISLYACFRFSVGSAKAGYSRLLSALSIVSTDAEPANRAVWLTPDDPEAHYTRALALVNLNRLPEAAVEFREALRLRPHHYYEWLDLGVTLDRLNDQPAALAALNESVRLAPRFAQPRWQLGSLLFRQGRYDQAFDELRQGAKSNPALFENLLGLAFVAANGDVAQVDSFVKPGTAQEHLALADFLATQGKGADAARHVKEAGTLEDAERPLLRKVINDLIATKQYKEAYLAWSAGRNLPAGTADTGQLLNGNFNDAITQNDPGFGWQLTNSSTVALSIDASGAPPGSRSILMEFRGEQPGANPILSQLVLVQPKTKYSLTVMARSESLVTGGPPMVVVLDAADQQVLGKSGPINTNSGTWGEIKLDFATNESTAAVIVAIKRLDCAENPCPIFGRLWLTKFSLAKS